MPNFDFSINFSTVFSSLIGWVFVAILAYHLFKKQLQKPRIWKIFIVFLIGIFSFSFSWFMFDTLIKIPILPLGVCVLYLFMKLMEQIPAFKENKFYSDEWYEKTYMNDETNKREERFPYQLIDSKSKWGSGLATLIFVEDDGKGILISTPKYQLYFRSEISLLEEEN